MFEAKIAHKSRSIITAAGKVNAPVSVECTDPKGQDRIERKTPTHSIEALSPGTPG